MASHVLKCEQFLKILKILIGDFNFNYPDSTYVVTSLLSISKDYNLTFKLYFNIWINNIEVSSGIKR
jgi:hypothetical protein